MFLDSKLDDDKQAIVLFGIEHFCIATYIHDHMRVKYFGFFLSRKIL